jgi:hypothetical protein
MKTLATAFVELAAYIQIAKFDDPDEEQGAKELVQWCLIQSTPEERAMIAGVARERAKEAAAKGLPRKDVEFYLSLSHWAKHHQKYG